MAVPEKCDVCGDRHHKHQAHRFPKPVAIEVAKETLAYMKAGGTFKASVEPSGVLASAEAWFDLKCEVCGEEFEAKRRHAKTCSAKCRQRKRRGK